MTAPAIPGFTYVEHLGTGGFADVLLYEQAWPRQRVAVKVVRADVALDEREKALFRSEADALARLADHPYIVSVLTAGETDDGRPYLVMRYCPPPDLGVRVRSSPMSVADAVSAGIKLASAVETAHRSGILHRDIKPSNVLVTTYSEPALSDFGIAGRVHEVDAEHEVRISFPWAPPELVDGRSNGSVASDVYSLGATIWNLLVGHSPFAIPHGDNSSHALTARILAAPPPTTRRPDVPPALDRLLQQCLAKRPEHRPQSALELARGLQRVEAAAGYPRTPIAVETTEDVATAVAPTEPVDGDATRLKPVAVVPSAPRPTHAPPAVPPTAGAGPVQPPVGPPAAPRSRGAVLGAAAAAAVLGVAAALVLLTGGDGPADDREARPTDGPSTPSDVLVGAPPPAPVVSAREAPDGARFTWRSVDTASPDDSWEWRDPATGDGDRVLDRSVTLSGVGRICIEVRLVRGTAASGWTKKCRG